MKEQEYANKITFIERLHRFAEVGGETLYDLDYDRIGYNESRGERLLALGIAKYLADPNIPKDTPGINWYRDLHSHLVDAFIEFRTHAQWSALRKAYTIKTEQEIPDLVDVHVGGLHRLLVTRDLSHLCTVLSGEKWLGPRLEAYFGAQQLCIDQAWERFVRIGYRQLMPRIKTEKHRGNRATFGSTTLTTYAIAGRVTFTFQRGKNDSMTYVADDSDMHGERSGPNSTATPYATCISMINEVSDSWVLDKMSPDTKIL